MRKNIDPGLALLLLAVVLVLGSYFIARYRHRFVQTRADLVRRLPQGDATTFFADVHLLRQAGLLSTFAGSHGQSEPDYQRFVRETGFDYSRDLDALAGSYRNEQLALFLQGRFDWSHLRRYPAQHGGSCNERTCVLPGSQPGRWISFGELQPDVLALFVGRDRQAASKLLQEAPRPSAEFPDDPVWVRPARTLFQNPSTLPLPVRMFVIALQSASRVVISARQSEKKDSAYTLRLNAHFENSATADTARTQFEVDTKMAKAELAREHAAPNPADLSGLLTSGVFQTVGSDMIAQWPIKQQLLQSLR